MGLMLALEKEEAEEQEILEGIRQMMQLLVEEQEEVKHQDNKMVEKVIFLDESLKSFRRFEQKADFGRTGRLYGDDGRGSQ